MKIVCLDRDGIINQYPGHGDYVTRVKDFHLLKGVLDGIKRLNDAQFKVFVISNQACVGCGIISQKKLDQITAKLLKAAKQKHVKFNGIFYCTHKPDEGCDCRKPKIGNIKKALSSVGSTLSTVRSGFFVGDTDKDIEAGHNAGLVTILAETGRDRLKDFKHKKFKPHYVVSDFNRAVEIILNYENSHHSRNRRRRA